jgi:hypothetical protein
MEDKGKFEDLFEDLSIVEVEDRLAFLEADCGRCSEEAFVVEP